MPKNEIDYFGLSNRIYKKRLKLSDVQDRLEKVAFDIVRFRDNDNAAALWQVQSADDGDYIVALYDPDDDQKTAQEWSVILSKTASAIQVSYKGDPIVKVATDQLGLPQEEISKVEKYLPSKLAGNKKLVKALLNQLNEPARKQILTKYPELS